jgi:flagella basal body P-ring formation protein FlgA
MRSIFVALLVAFPLCVRAAEPLSLAEAAERFVERSASLPDGSVQAQSIDRQIPLGDCASGWMWSFPYEARTTVQVTCTASPTSSRRFVAVRYPYQQSRREDRVPSPTAQRSFVVAARDLAVGTVLSAGDLEVAAASPKDRVFSSTLSDPSALVGLALTRPVRQGEPIGRADARGVQVVKRNSPVSAWSAFPGGRVVAKLMSLQTGKVGDWVELENPQSGRRLRGIVQADGTVRISGGATSGGGTQGTASQVDFTAR